MPTYDFRCRACETVFEARVPAGESAPCPACGAQEVQRLYSPVAINMGPALRGAAAKRSNAERSKREELRWEGFRKQRERLGLPPREKPPA